MMGRRSEAEPEMVSRRQEEARSKIGVRPDVRPPAAEGLEWAGWPAHKHESKQRTKSNDGKRRSRAMLIINTKSGPRDDSITHLKRIVDLLAAHRIDAEVRVKLSKRQARAEASRAARRGIRLVIAAGGDGTVAAVARGLIGTRAALGVLPLGTYNNVAGSLGIPTDIEAACALLAVGKARAVDVGEVRVAGQKKPRLFLEMASVGLTAALMPAGQEMKDGDWDDAAELLPNAVGMRCADAELTVDGVHPAVRARTMLIEIANAPRMGPALVAAPDARMDDGKLHVSIYNDMGLGALAAHFWRLKAGREPEGERIQRFSAQSIDVDCVPPLPVVTDSRVVGTTPARFKVSRGALRAIVGYGIGLERLHGDASISTAVAEAQIAAGKALALEQITDEREEAEVLAAARSPLHADGALSDALRIALPLVGRLAGTGAHLRKLGLPAIAVAGALAVPTIKLVMRRAAG